MRSALSILTVVISLATALFFWMYLQRGKLEYTTEGRYFSAEEGVVYLEQTRDSYGLLAIVGLVTTTILVTVWIRSKKTAD